jgi:hypothetical protein
LSYPYSETIPPDQRSSETITNGPAYNAPDAELTTYETNNLNQLLRTKSPDKVF